jgi:hypothetical protein
VAGATEVPPQREFSPTMRVDVLVADWKASIPVELPQEERERALYEKAWDAYREGDYGFGLWCWHECDRLTNALDHSLKEVTRVLGPGHFFGFSHRRAVAGAVPVERIYRPRKGDMSTPRTDAFVLPHYQVLCVYLVRAASGDPKSKAQLEIALGELEDRRRADPFLRYFETFRDLMNRPSGGGAAPTAVPSAPAPEPAAAPPAKARSRRKATPARAAKAEPSTPAE